MISGGTDIDEFSGYAEQRETFQRAIAAGWSGIEPSVLGTYTANKELERAVMYLEAKAWPDKSSAISADATKGR
jgi:hypothetical protein